MSGLAQIAGLEGVPMQVRSEYEAMEAAQAAANAAAAPEAPAGEAPATEGAQAAPAAPDPMAEMQRQLDVMAQQQAVLRGKYDAEVPRLHAALQQKDAELAAVQQELAAARAAAAPQDAQSRYGLTPEESELGSEVISMAEKIAAKAREADQAVIREMQARLDAVQAAQRQAPAESAKEAFFTTLNNRCPGWRAIEQDARWDPWLKIGDRLSRWNTASAEYQDPLTIAQLLLEFQAEAMAQDRQARVQAPAAGPAGPSASAQVVPPTRGGGPQDAPPAGRSIEAILAEMNQATMTGAFRNGEKMRALELEYQAALKTVNFKTPAA